MKISTIKKGLVLLTMSAGVFVVGCELIVDFDRTKIVEPSAEASLPDVNIPETFTPVSEAGPADAEAGTTEDAGDGGTDAADAADANDQ